MAKTVGVIVARFQVPELSDAHDSLIRHVRRHCKEVCVMLGVAPRVDRRNPLSFEMREDMVRTEYPDINHVHPLRDVPGDDKTWSYNLDMFIGLLFPLAGEITLFGGRDSFIKHYTGTNRVVTVAFGAARSGSTIRQEIGHSAPEGTASFRKGVIYAVENYLGSEPSAVDGLLQGVPLEAIPAEDTTGL